MVFLQGKESTGMSAEHIPLSWSATLAVTGGLGTNKAGALFHIHDGGWAAGGLCKPLSLLH